ncbi:MAG: LacI family DNA-binding transcriptional regulator, partial [Actinomycetes bacterium]
SLVAQQLVDGVIVMEVEADDPRVPLLQRQHARFVMLGRTANNQGLDYVDTDFERAAFDALEHLVDRGHRRVLFITDPGAALHRGLGPSLRISSALAEHARRLGVELTTSNVHRTYGGGRGALEQFISSGSTATAVLTFNDQATVGFLHAAQVAGLSIPRDLSLLAMGMGEDAAELSPPLSTVTPPVAELTATAVGMLNERISGRTPVQRHVLLRALLTDRGSVAAPR